MTISEDPTGFRKPTNAKDRVASNRLDMTLFPESAAAYGALALTEGDLKYGANNYRVEGVLASVYVAALRRHMAKWWDGESDDPVTGVPHLANAMACLAILIDSSVAGKLRDDRPPVGSMASLLSIFEIRVAALRKQFQNPPERFTQQRIEQCAEVLDELDPRPGGELRYNKGTRLYGGDL